MIAGLDCTTSVQIKYTVGLESVYEYKSEYSVHTKTGKLDQASGFICCVQNYLLAAT